jgi:NADH dehydrogenase
LTATESSRPRVLILGGGFAGIGAARKLKGADVDIVLVDRHDYHTFQPLLYQVATDLLETSAVGHALRDLFHDQSNVTVHVATATEIDLEQKQVAFSEMGPLGYDYLVLALGAGVNFFGTPGADEHSFPMYTLSDAVRLRGHVLERWEAADREPSLLDDGALNIVIVGGGPTGVESAGALADLYRHSFAKDYPQVDHQKARVVLVEAGPVLFSMFHQELQAYAKKSLEGFGVEVLLGEAVSSVDATRVALKSGEVIAAHTLVWGAGLQASPVAGALGVELGRGRRVPVGPDLTVAGHPEVYAVGDIASITDAKSSEVLPQLGSVALQAGEHAGESIARLVKGKEPKSFAYHDKGTMAAIGRGAAVVQFRGGRTMTGYPAMLAWGSVHLALLSTGEDRAKAVIDWVWAGFTHERPGRISVTADEPERRPV